MTNHDVEHAIKKRMSGDVRDAFVAIGQCFLQGAPFSCHCQGSVAADSCCHWAMETPSGACGLGHLESPYRGPGLHPCTKEGLWLMQWCHSSLL